MADPHTNESNTRKSNVQEKDETASKKFILFGKEVGGWGAALALVLSIASLAVQLLGWVRGPDIVTAPVFSVGFTCSTLSHGPSCGGGDTGNVVVLVETLAFSNRGSSAHPGVVHPGAMTMEFFGPQGDLLKSIRLQAKYLAHRTPTEKKLLPLPPLQVTGQAAASYNGDVGYWPRFTRSADGERSRSNFLPFTTFKSMLVDGIDGKPVTTIRLRLEPQLMQRNWSDIAVTCTVSIDAPTREAAKNPLVGEFPRDCEERIERDAV